jgi:hypothetical protein
MSDKPKNLKSDVEAKKAYVVHLESLGLYKSIKITQAPSDITAITHDGVIHYKEIKFTRKTAKTDKIYFGGTSTTEWEAALDNPDTYWFVITLPTSTGWRFKEYTPVEFMKISVMSPPQVKFHYDLINEKIIEKKTKKSIKATESNLRAVIELYKKLK